MTTSDITTVSNSLTAELPSHTSELLTDAQDVNSMKSSVTVQTISIPMKLEALTSLVRDKLKHVLDEPLQEELAALLNLIPELDTSYNERFIPIVEIAVRSLLSETPNMTLAKEIREDIERRVHRSPLITIIRGGGSPPTRVILGLGTLLYIFIPILLFLPSLKNTTDITDLESFPLLLVGLAGACGSVVSILVRIQEFESPKNSDPSLLFFTGFFKPVIGTAFALFVFATLKAGLIPLDISESIEGLYFFGALAFVAGFSERFAKDIAARAEQTIVAVQASTHES